MFCRKTIPHHPFFLQSNRIWIIISPKYNIFTVFNPTIQYNAMIFG